MVRREARRVSTITAETSLRQAQMRNKSGMSEEQAPGQLFVTLGPCRPAGSLREQRRFPRALPTFRSKRAIDAGVLHHTWPFTLKFRSWGPDLYPRHRARSRARRVGCGVRVATEQKTDIIGLEKCKSLSPLL